MGNLFQALLGDVDVGTVDDLGDVLMVKMLKAYLGPIGMIWICRIDITGMKLTKIFKILSSRKITTSTTHRLKNLKKYPQTRTPWFFHGFSMVFLI